MTRTARRAGFPASVTLTTATTLVAAMLVAAAPAASLVSAAPTGAQTTAVTTATAPSASTGTGTAAAAATITSSSEAGATRSVVLNPASTSPSTPAPDPTPTASAAAGPTWSVAPADTPTATDRSHFDYSLVPGAEIDDAFEISNGGTAPLTLVVYAADAFTTREGGIDLLPEGTASADAGTWITMAADTVTIQPGEASTVPFHISVPSDATPGDHPAGIVSSARTDTAGATVQVDRRLGSRVYLRVEGEFAPAVRISDVAVDYSGMWNPFGMGSVTVGYTIENTGNTRATATSALEVAGPFGIAPAATGSEQLTEVLPGSMIDVEQRLDGIAALLWLSGRVRIAPEGVGIGGAPLATEEKAFGMLALPVIPLAVVVLLAAAAALAVTGLRRRRAGSSRPGRRPGADG